MTDLKKSPTPRSFLSLTYWYNRLGASSSHWRVETSSLPAKRWLHRRLLKEPYRAAIKGEHYSYSVKPEDFEQLITDYSSFNP